MTTPDLVSLLRRRIEESLTKRDPSVLAIVGSGVSIQATGKAPAASWGGLLRLGSERCEQVAANWRTRRFDATGVLVKLASPKVADWVSAATAIEKTLRAAKASVYKDWLRETLGELKPTQPEVLHALGALGVPLATTNYDGLLEHALGLQGATWRTHGLVDQILTGKYPGNAVLHLHGHFSEPASVILGASSYEKVLGDKRAQSTLRHLLMSRDLIFVGMGGGLDDPNFGALIDWALNVTLPESRYHFLLLRESETHAYRARIPLTSRIHVVSYGADYPDLVPFLRSLVPAAGGTGSALSGSAGSAAQGNLPSAWVGHHVTPQFEQQKKNALRFIQESPALTKALLENGFGNSTLSGAAFAQTVLDNLLPLSPNEVTDKLAALAAATQLLDPVRELLWRILPLASGWDEVFQEAEATGASRSVLVLPWRTTTLAEIEMARMDGRRVTFEPEGEVPQGILHVPLPTAAYAPLFDSEGARLAEAVLRNLHSEQPPDSSVPNADFWRSIRKAFPSEKEFFEEAKSTLNNDDFGGRRYLLFIDQLLIPHGAEPDAAWTVAQTAIQKVLPGLRLVRLKGQRTEKSKETEILRPIQKIRRLS